MSKGRKVSWAAAFIVALTAVSLSAASVGYWKFNEATSGYAGTAQGSVLDSSGNGLHGYGVGITTPSYVTGWSPYNDGSAFRFTTADDEIWVPDNALLGFPTGTSFTVEALVKSSGTTFGSNNRGIVVKRSQLQTGPGYWLRTSGDKLHAALIDSGGNTQLSGTSDIVDGHWHHVAMVYDATTHMLKLYVDYQLETSAPATRGDIISTPVNDPLIVGGWYDLDLTHQWDGDIDFVRISTGALTPMEFMLPNATGACCASDGTCSETLPAACAGEWQGAETTCAQTTCTVLGACCQTDGTCAQTTQDTCNGTWAGPGTSCGTEGVCLGSCCANDGTCSETAEKSCSGAWGGFGTSCDTASCTGACCNGDGTCSETTADACTGAWAGPGTTCETASCQGACCDSGGNCSLSTADSCTGQWQGAGSSCNQPCTASVSGYWMFSELPAGSLASTASGAIVDYSGNALNGTVVASTLPTYAMGNYDYSNDTSIHIVNGSHVEIPDNASINFAGGASFSIEAMVRSTVVPSIGAVIVSKRAPSTITGARPGYWLRGVPTTINGVTITTLQATLIDANGTFSITGDQNIADGAWHHVAMVYDGSIGRLRIYVDHQIDYAATSVRASLSNDAALIIGDFLQQNNPSTAWQGDIDFVRVTAAVLWPEDFIQPAAPPAGACCLDDGTCSNVSLSECAALDGYWHGENTSCETYSCPQPGACCMGDGTCTFCLQGDCTGTFMGEGTTCEETNCMGACCGYDGTCSDTYKDACNGTWQGIGTTCATTTCVAYGVQVGYWKFREATSGSVSTDEGAVLDSSDYDLNGTALGPVTPTYVEGDAEYFDGAALNWAVGADYTRAIQIPNNSVINFVAGQSFTAEALVRSTYRPAVGMMILAKRAPTSSGSTRPGYWLRGVPKAVSGSTVTALEAIIIDASGNNRISGTKDIADGNWHHVAMVFDSPNKWLSVYVDYALDARATLTRGSSSNTAPLMIGNFIDTDVSTTWRGDIDFVRMSLGPVDPSLFVHPPEIASADLDGDGDVDQDDLLIFASCGTGSQAGPPTSACSMADFDGDEDVDMDDFARLQRCLGATGAAVYTCLE